MNEINKQIEQGLKDLLHLIELELTPNIEKINGN
jgi:hypothetical protein